MMHGDIKGIDHVLTGEMVDSELTGKDSILVDKKTFITILHAVRNQKFIENHPEREQKSRQYIIDSIYAWMLKLVRTYPINSDELDDVFKEVSNEGDTYTFHFCRPDTEEVLLSARGVDVVEAWCNLEKAFGGNPIPSSKDYKVKAFVNEIYSK